MKKLVYFLGILMLFVALIFTQKAYLNAGLTGLLLSFVSVAPFIIGTIFLAIAVWAIVKWLRIKKMNKNT